MDDCSQAHKASRGCPKPRRGHRLGQRCHAACGPVILGQLILEIDAWRKRHSHRSANCVTRTRDGAAKRRRSPRSRSLAVAPYHVPPRLETTLRRSACDGSRAFVAKTDPKRTSADTSVPARATFVARKDYFGGPDSLPPAMPSRSAMRTSSGSVSACIFRMI